MGSRTLMIAVGMWFAAGCGHDYEVTSFSFSPNGEYLLVHASDPNVLDDTCEDSIWKLSDGSWRDLGESTEGQSTWADSEGKQWFFTTRIYGDDEVVDAKTTRTLTVDGYPYKGAGTSLIFVAADGQSDRLLDIDTGVAQELGAAWASDFGPAGSLIMAVRNSEPIPGSSDEVGDLVLHEQDGNEISAGLVCHGPSGQPAVVSPDGTELVLVRPAGSLWSYEVVLFEIQTREVQVLASTRSCLTAAEFGPTGIAFYTLDEGADPDAFTLDLFRDGETVVVDRGRLNGFVHADAGLYYEMIPAGQEGFFPSELHYFDVDTGVVTHMADAEFLVQVCPEDSRRVIYFVPKDGESCTAVVQDVGAEPTELGDGCSAIWIGRDIVLYDDLARTLELCREDGTAASVAEAVASVAAQPGGTMVAIISGDELVVLDAKSGATSAIDEGVESNGLFSDLRWSPQGRHLAYVKEGEIRLWDAELQQVASPPE